LSSFIKVIGYREWFNEKTKKIKTKHIFFDQPYNFRDHQALFNSVEGFLNSITVSEQYNLHYTINHMPQGAQKKTEVSHIEIVPLDIDNIFTDRIEEYIQVVEEVVGVKRDHFVCIFTGNGIQIVFKLDVPLKDEGELNALKKSYILLCDKIMDTIKERKLATEYMVGKKEKKTHMDAQIFRVGTLRLPNTINKKKDRPDTVSKFITRTLKPVSLERLQLYFEQKVTTTKVSGVETFWGKTDSKYAFKECAALKEFKDKKGKISYGHWFSAVSVVSRFNDIDGEALSHQLSSGDPEYDRDQTQQMIDSSRLKSGPHTCTTFSQSFEGCKGCKYFNTKVKSPINLRSKDFLSYEETGFHKQDVNSNKWQVVHKQLREKFKQDHNFISIDTTEELYLYNYEDNCWRTEQRPTSERRIADYFSAKPGDLAQSSIIKESLYHVKQSSLLTAQTFLEKSVGKVNFVNGHLEIRDNKCIFFPKTVDSFKEYFTFSLPFLYDETAECPKFLEFLKDVSLDRPDIELCLTEFMGYVMSNDEYWSHKFMVFQGKGANGKSVLLELIRHLVGEGNYSSLNLADLTNEQKLEVLVGKIANLSDEQPDKRIMDNSALKNLTAGGRFQYKRVYHPVGEAYCRAKFIFSSNHPITSGDTSMGVMRRFLPIQFDANFEPMLGPVRKTPDPHITKKLKEEAAGIFNLCMARYLEAKHRGSFTMPLSSKESIEEFMQTSSPIKDYIEECFETEKYLNLNPNSANELFLRAPYYDVSPSLGYSRIDINEIRKDYIQWGKDRGMKSEYNIQNFSREFRMALSAFVADTKVVDELYKRCKKENKLKTVFVGSWAPFFDSVNV